MTRISRKVRAEAIEACIDIAAWWSTPPGEMRHPHSSGGYRQAVMRLAYAAMGAVETVIVDDPETVWIEAAAILHDGWSPGEPVRLLK